jgi:aspartate ammonia-lyase
VRAYARIKQAAARVNGRLGLLPTRWAAAIAAAAEQVAENRVPEAGVIDALQAGAGTPAHMNVNEVVANLANERLGGRRGVYARALVAGSLIEATALSPYLGYDVTAELVKRARATGRPLREVVAGHGLLDPRALDRVLSPASLTGPRVTDVALRNRVQRAPAYRAFRTALARE